MMKKIVLVVAACLASKGDGSEYIHGCYTYATVVRLKGYPHGMVGLNVRDPINNPYNLQRADTTTQILYSGPDAPGRLTHCETTFAGTLEGDIKRAFQEIEQKLATLESSVGQQNTAAHARMDLMFTQLEVIKTESFLKEEFYAAVSEKDFKEAFATYSRYTGQKENLKRTFVAECKSYLEGLEKEAFELTDDFGLYTELNGKVSSLLSTATIPDQEILDGLINHQTSVKLHLIKRGLSLANVKAKARLLSNR